MSIYNTTETTFRKAVSTQLPKEIKVAAKKVRKKINHTGWNFFDLHPTTWLDVDGALTPETHTIVGTLKHHDLSEFYWIHSNCSVKRNGKFQPFDYKSLCNVVLPLLFGIYQHNGKIVQINLNLYRTEGELKFRKLTSQQIRGYLFRQINEIDTRLGHCDEVKSVFNSDIFSTDKEWKLLLTTTELLNFLPELPMKGTKVMVQTLQVEEGKVVFGKDVKEVNHASSSTESQMIEWCLNNTGTITSDTFHTELDVIGWEVGNNKGRVRRMNNILCAHGMKVYRQQMRISGTSERTWIYKIISMRLS